MSLTKPASARKDLAKTAESPPRFESDGQNWYYKIEMAPGVFTPGRPIATLPVVRDVLGRVEMKNCRVLDIGTQEFVAPILIENQQPDEVIAYDRLSLVDRFKQVNKVYRLDHTQYVHGLPLHALRQNLLSQQISPVFDVVNFTGVLYHMVDPLAGLAIARSFLRTNGLMVFETSCSTGKGYTAECNHHGALYPGSNYFQVAPKALDYWLRMLQMQVLDVFWFGRGKVNRVFFILRAVDQVIAEESDEWIRKAFLHKDLEVYGLDYGSLRRHAGPEVAYSPFENLGPLRFTKTSPSYVDVYTTLKKRKHVPANPERAMITLADLGPRGDQQAPFLRTPH